MPCIYVNSLQWPMTFEETRSTMRVVQRQLQNCVSVFQPAMSDVTLLEGNPTLELHFLLRHAQFPADKKVSVTWSNTGPLRVVRHQYDIVAETRDVAKGELMIYLIDQFKSLQKASNTVIVFLDRFKNTTALLSFQIDASKLKFDVYIDGALMAAITVAQNVTLDSADVTGSIITYALFNRATTNSNEFDQFNDLRELTAICHGFGANMHQFQQKPSMQNVGDSAHLWYAINKICALLEHKLS